MVEANIEARNGAHIPVKLKKVIAIRFDWVKQYRTPEGKRQEAINFYLIAYCLASKVNSPNQMEVL